MNNPTVVVRQCPRLLEIVKTIFGDELVTKAWVGHSPCIDTDTYIKDSLDATERDIKISKLTLRYDASRIVVLFNNGNIVTFVNSEWAYFERLNPSDIVSESKL